MGKRKHKDKTTSRLKEKIRRLEDRLHHRDHRRYYDEYSSDESNNYDDRRDYLQSPRRRYNSRSSSTDRLYFTESEDYELQRPKSVATPIPNTHTENGGTGESQTQQIIQVPKEVDLTASTSGQEPSTSATTSLPVEILEALGDPKGKDEVFGPKIPDEISKRWGRILVDGLTKEQRQEITEKTLIPDNFRLIKAPLLNSEILPTLGDPVKNRDKLLEKAQNHLGLGIAGLANLAATVIEKDLSKIEILRNISEISQIFLDLHHENTLTRRKLVITSLDKKFTEVVKDAKRDSFLFGAELGDKIRACKTAERAGLLMKRNVPSTASHGRKLSAQGNWKGSPRVQGQRAYRQGGPRTHRYSGQASRRQPPLATDRPTATTTPRTGAKTRKP